YQFFSLFYLLYTAHTDSYPLSLHDALPISCHGSSLQSRAEELLHLAGVGAAAGLLHHLADQRVDHAVLAPAELLDEHRVGVDHLDRKSTRLNSSHVAISYAVFCLKKKKIIC